AVVEKLPHPIERNQSGRRLILVTDMDNTQLEKAIRDFTELYERNDAHIDQPDSITNRDGAFYLSFSPNLDYDSFCFWVNYLVYRKKGERYDVT
ncbi:MAG: hypothetical protein IKZ83_05520, partial [Prevotella sp.]|nr:hypothetical protein [Prevotella sp.]